MQAVASTIESLRCAHQSAELATCPNNSQWLTKSVTKVSDGLYTYMKEPDLVYVMEKVDSESMVHWWKYSDDEITVANRAVCRHSFKSEKAKASGLSLPETDRKKIEVVRATQDPLHKFKWCISYCNLNGVDVWSAYVSNSDVNRRFRYETKGDCESIEMAVAVLTHIDVPFQLHMGVHRNPEHILGEKDTHKGISMDLHGFAAFFLRNVMEQRKEFVITTPMKSMANIFKQHLDPTCYQEGSNFSGSFIKTKGKNHYDNNYKFELLSADSSEEIIFKVETPDEVEQHRWFFSNTQTVDYFIIKVDSIAKLPGYNGLSTRG
ncbi:hypothetical protein [Endozoicomonas sp. YOMI1]|uniref:hypothetical protein n=1 Tax=Endozoicomonas sp. YOMI1 TaxID=2828739 RepID=UPI00214966A1|nr:hypothetical protein [Endozoicomonas sp. YOMI1]